MADRLGEAEQMYRRAHEISEHSGGNNYALLSFYAQHGRTADLARLDAEMLARRTARFGAQSERVADHLLGMGRCYARLGDPARAIASYERAYAMLTTLPGVEAWKIRDCRAELIRLYIAAGRTADAARLQAAP